MAFRIYTKTGDKGQTSLFGGRRVPKSHLRVEAYGTLDELNAFIGQLRDLTPNLLHLNAILQTVQERLFSLGAYFASDPQKQLIQPDIVVGDIALLEREIDAMESVLPPLKNFILPGGHPAVSAAHVCRTVCRRAERCAVALHRREALVPEALEYLNRLSDYFFVAGRKIAFDLEVEEILWKPRT